MIKSKSGNFFSKNEQGYALLIVLLALVLISVLGMSLLTISNNTLKTSANERTDQSLFYIAEAGLIDRKAALTKEIKEAYSDAVLEYKKELIENSKKDPSKQIKISFQEIFKERLPNSDASKKETYTNFEEHFSKKPLAEISILQEEQDTKMFYTITSTGSVENSKTSRSVSQKIIVDLNSASFDGNSINGKYTVYARNKIEYEYYDMKNNVIGSIASATYDHVISPGSQIPLIHDPNNYDSLLANKYYEKLAFDTKKFINATYYPSNSNLINNNNLIAENWDKYNDTTLQLTDNLKLSTFSLSNGGMTFTIDVGNSDKILYLKKLELNGYINVIGSGKLTIFVEDEIIFGNTFLNQKGASNNLSIYYAGNKELNFSNNTFVTANMYVKQADLTYQGGGAFNGKFYSNGVGTITLAGGIFNESVDFIVPNYNVTMGGSATIKGSIICNNLYLHGDASIISGNSSLDDSITINESAPIKYETLIEK
ncbi:hypothetical protein ACQKII_16275 [Lysinibacillus sp. NPDC048646]|uniref:hypothetical protein n=1 Tax=Lysinibacillus sp. NPDC048646 TaxID=3390574 RepID=UPI003D026032